MSRLAVHRGQGRSCKSLTRSWVGAGLPANAAVTRAPKPFAAKAAATQNRRKRTGSEGIRALLPPHEHEVAALMPGLADVGELRHLLGVHRHGAPEIGEK